MYTVKSYNSSNPEDMKKLKVKCFMAFCFHSGLNDPDIIKEVTAVGKEVQQVSQAVQKAPSAVKKQTECCALL